MLKRQRQGQVFHKLVFIGLMALGMLLPVAAQAELADGSDVLPLYRGGLDNAANETVPEPAVEPDAAEAPLQVASRLPEPGVMTQQVATATGNEFFNEDPPLITLGEYLRSGYLMKDHKPLGRIIRNDEFTANAATTEMVNLDIGTDKGLKPGDRLLVYTVNDNFNQGYDFETPVKHPVRKGYALHGDSEVREESIPNNIWDFQVGNEETGVWRKKVDWFDEWMVPQGDAEGNMLRVVGVIDVVAVDENRARAVVVEMMELMPRGAYVTPFPKNLPAMLKKGQRGVSKNLSGYILDHREGYLMASENDIVYIDLGQADNVQPGDRFDIIAASKEEKLEYRSLISALEPMWEDDPRPMMDRTIGELVVVKVGETSSTAMILDGEEPILPGHRVRSKR
ncbi:MAG: hypothetical protein KC553_09735 [Nitrospina sp.]|nr:hypothetical protein [Nitrospina sp.]